MKKSKYKYKQYAVSMPVCKPYIDKLNINSLIQQADDCLKHSLDFNLFNNATYIKYRRGLNRCHRCGLKLRNEK